MKILMVCLGNICRSPLAEGIMKEKVRQRGLNWHVDSAGTGGWHEGEKPDPRSISTARNHGIDITGQRARQIRHADLEHYDLILTMDEDNHHNVRSMALQSSSDPEKVHMIMNFVHPGENISVPDPYWNNDGFEEVYQMLDKACDQVIKRCLSSAG